MSLTWDCIRIGAHCSEPRGTFQIPITGDSGAYPFDSYQFSQDFLIDTNPVNMSEMLDTSTSLRFEETAGQWHLDGGHIAHVFDGDSSAGPGKYVMGNAHLAATLSRDGSTRTYVMALAATPLAFALLFFHILFINPSTRKTPLPEFLVAMSATAVAVLPLRFVLVPSEINDLTLTDALLGLGVAVLVAVALARYGRDLWPAGRR